MQLLTVVIAAPLVAGLVAYYHGLPLPEPWKNQLRKPRTVKSLITHYHRRVGFTDPVVLPDESGPQEFKPIIWNAQVFDYSCLLDRPFPEDFLCGDDLPADLNELSATGGEPVQGNGDGINSICLPPSSSSSASLDVSFWSALTDLHNQVRHSLHRLLLQPQPN
jgi:hypothetical protein